MGREELERYRRARGPVQPRQERRQRLVQREETAREEARHGQRDDGLGDAREVERRAVLDRARGAARESAVRASPPDRPELPGDDGARRRAVAVDDQGRHPAEIDGPTRRTHAHPRFIAGSSRHVELVEARATESDRAET